MIECETFALSLDDREICGDICLPERERPPYVITCHGLFSSRESQKFQKIGALLVRNGFAAVLFDFGGCGESTGSIAETTVSRRLQELRAVAGLMSRHPALGAPFGIVGSSLGGLVGALFAAESTVAAVSLWATPYDMHQVARNMPPEDLSLLHDGFWEDAEQFQPAAALGNLNTVQIIHGSDDEIVPVSHAHEIYKKVQDPRQLEIIHGADHSISNARHLLRALQVSLAWFQKYLP